MECSDKHDAPRGQARQKNPRQSNIRTGLLFFLPHIIIKDCSHSFVEKPLGMDYKLSYQQYFCHRGSISFLVLRHPLSLPLLLSCQQYFCHRGSHQFLVEEAFSTFSALSCPSPLLISSLDTGAYSSVIL